MISLDLKNSKVNTSKFEDKLALAKKKFTTQDIGFKKLPYQYPQLLSEFKKVDDLMSGKNTLVIVGVGGSDLGARAIRMALTRQYYNEFANISLNPEKKVYFIGDTTDPKPLLDLFDIINLERTLFLIVSKSGSTIEQSANFVYIHSKYKKSGLEPQKYITFLTDSKDGDLQDIARKSKYITLDFPKDVGGRFSVLSIVGMVLSHILNIDTDKMLQGAIDLDKSINESEGLDDLVSRYTLHKLAEYKSGKNISVLMLYEYSLYDFGKWYQQLWAESLGKKFNTKGEVVNEGQTPVSVVGSTFQHSQLQLYNEGPDDKFFTFVKAENANDDLLMPTEFDGIKNFAYLKGKTLHDILNYQQEATAYSLGQSGRSYSTISIPQVDAYHLGQLFYFFEVAVTMFGFALDINPFDQPGVELGKQRLAELMNSN